MNIIFLGISYIDEGLAASKRIQNYINELIKYDDVIVNNLIISNKKNVLNNNKSGSLNKVEYLKINYGHLINLFKIANFFYNGLRFIKNKRITNDKNIIYTLGYPNIIDITFLIYAKILDYKIVFDLGEDRSLYSKNLKLRTRLKNYSSVILFDRINFFADGCITISNHLYKRVREVSKNKIPLLLIPTTVNFSALENLKKHPQDNTIKLFYGGSFGEKDGVYFLIKAFEIINQKYSTTKLLLSGKGSNEQMKIINKLIGESDSKDNIIYLGFLNDSEYYSTIINSDILCMTRVNTPFANAGFPVKLGEYLATGNPVLSSDVSDIRFYLKNKANAMITKPESISSIVEAIIFLIENPKEAVQIGEKGKKAALKYFDSRILSKKFYEFVKKL